MDIQNISGADSVPKGFSVKTEIPNETETKDQALQVKEETRPPEENKGQNVDVTA